VAISHRFDQQTGIRLGWDDCRPGLAAPQNPIRSVQFQIALELFGIGTVTGIAVLGENGPYVGFEEVDLLRSGFVGVVNGSIRREGKDQQGR
ncbi:MAG TPA: hypothetical protein VHH88_11990, partial [Verrucomicrobiae bacterium]|nr:hypothetical protein [Verrucomicrobiae bacterium]